MIGFEQRLGTPQPSREESVPGSQRTPKKRFGRQLRRLGRRIGYYFRRTSLLLTLAAENAAIFSTLLLVPSLLAGVIVTALLVSKQALLVKAGGIAAATALPFLLSLYFYLKNLSRDRRADLAVRARRYSDAVVLQYVFDQVLQLQDMVCGDDARIAPLGSRAAMAIESEFVRSRAFYIRLVMDEAARHFRISREVLEEAILVSAMVLENRSERRVWLRYHLEGENISGGLRAEAALIEACADRVRQRCNMLKEVADDFATILRFVVKQPSTGRAMGAGARVLSRHVGKSSWGVILELLRLRHGVLLPGLLGVDDKPFGDARDAALRHYLEYPGEFHGPATKRAVDEALKVLKSKVGPRAVVLTVGYSQVVARTLAMLSKEVEIVVGVVTPTPESERDRIIFADEDRAMEAELLVEASLRGRVFRTSAGTVGELAGDLEVWIVMGAEGVTYDGTVLHPKGRVSMHRSLRPYCDHAGHRVVVSESCKVYDVAPEIRAARRLGSLTTLDYDVLVTDAGMFEGEARRSLGFVRAQWEEEVNRRLKERGMPDIFRSPGVPRVRLS